MYNNSKIAKAIRLAMMFGAGAAAAISAPTFAAAADEGAEEVEKIQVTGSRIKRTDMETASPVVVITRADIDASGDLSIADVLRNSVGNSFGSFSESSGFGGGTQSTATVNLRGMGSGRTLVLVDGKRMAPSPGGTGSTVDLNTIPFSVVDKVEILTDGASAVYGSDAVGGVINITLRKDFDGFNIKAQSQRPTQEGGDQDNVSMTFGLANDKGNIIISAEFDNKDIIYNRDRHYLQGHIDDTFEDSSAISLNGRTVKYTIEDANGDFRTTYRPAQLNGEDLCDERFVGKLPYKTDAYGADSKVCAFDYNAYAAKTAQITRTNLYSHGNYNLTDDITVFMTATATRKTSFGRFAPAAGGFDLLGSDMANQSIDLNPGDKITKATANWRFNDGGNRDSRSEEIILDFKTGLSGVTDWGNWEFGLQRNVNKTNQLGTGYINKLLASKFAADGSITTPESVALMDHTVIVNNKSDYTNVYAGVGVDSLFELPGGDAGAYFYTEYMETHFSRSVDPASDANNVIGSAGGSTDGHRTVSAAAAEIALPVLDNVEVTVAARYDNYSDFGSNLSPQLGVKYDFLEGWAVRASYGQGFAAPTFGQLTTKSQGFPWTYIDGFGWAQIEENRLGNENLEAEESETFNIGLVGEVIEGVEFTFDYYQIGIENEVVQYDRYRIMDDVEDGITPPLPNSVVNDAAGFPESFTISYVNEGETSQSGIDFNLRTHFDTDFGIFTTNLMISKILDYSVPREAGGKLYDESGLKNQPDLNGLLGLGYIYEDHSVKVNFRYIGKQLNDYDFDEECGCYIVDPDANDDDNKVTYVNSHLEVDVNYTWNALDNLKLTAGVTNLTDEDPEFDDVTKKSYEGTLYSIQGRSLYVGFEYKF